MRVAALHVLDPLCAPQVGAKQGLGALLLQTISKHADIALSCVNNNIIKAAIIVHDGTKVGNLQGCCMHMVMCLQDMNNACALQFFCYIVLFILLSLIGWTTYHSTAQNMHEAKSPGGLSCTWSPGCLARTAIRTVTRHSYSSFKAGMYSM